MLAFPLLDSGSSLRSCVKVVQSSCESRCLRSSTSRPPSTSTLSVNFWDFPILVRSPRVTSSFTYKPGDKGTAEVNSRQDTLALSLTALGPTLLPCQIPQRPALGSS